MHDPAIRPHRRADANSRSSIPSALGPWNHARTREYRDDPMSSLLRRTSLTQWILLAMLVGALVGWLWPGVGRELGPLSSIFLRLIKLIVVPLVFSTLVVGIAGHGEDLKKLGWLALKSLVYFELMTTVALLVGLAAGHLVRPGAGVVLPPPSAAAQAQSLAQAQPTLASVIEHIVPASFFDAAAKNEILQVVFFAVLFALGLMRVRGRPKEAVLEFCEGLSQTMFKVTGIVMLYAPVGVGAAIAVTVGQGGLGVLRNLAVLVLTLYAALALFLLVALLPVALWIRLPLRRFVQLVKEPALIAFATTSSEAALPKALENMEKLGVPRRIVAFVLPTGYSFNLDGSTLYLSLAALFVVQAAGIELSLGSELLLMLTLMVTSKGVAGVPRAGLVILSGTLLQFGLPLEGVAVILAVDSLMDMARTSMNLVGNCLATAVMARWEGEFAGVLARARE
jgi:proton glutamate symport protein